MARVWQLARPSGNSTGRLFAHVLQRTMFLVVLVSALFVDVSVAPQCECTMGRRSPHLAPLEPVVSGGQHTSPKGASTCYSCVVYTPRVFPTLALLPSGWRGSLAIPCPYCRLAQLRQRSIHTRRRIDQLRCPGNPPSLSVFRVGGERRPAGTTPAAGSHRRHDQHRRSALTATTWPMR